MTAIYLDHAATSPVLPEVAHAMLPFLTTYFGNPSSIHRLGRETRKVIDESRDKVAAAIHASPGEIVFTSGGTEADNMALAGVAFARKEEGMHIVTSGIEHYAVLHTCHDLERRGWRITYVPVDRSGRVNVEALKEAICEDTVLVSVMYANNEVGTLQPISELSAFLKEKDILFHTDAVQALGLVEIDVNQLGVDLLSASAHKINGPKGIGFLYVKDGVRLAPFFYGGNQEHGRRAGTENVAGIVGFTEALKYSEETMEQRRRQYESFRKQMLDVFDHEEVDVQVNGSSRSRLPHILNVYFPGTRVEPLLVNLDLAGIAVSSGSACTAGSLEPSHVLEAMYGKNGRGSSSVRFSFGYGNTLEEVERAALETARIVKNFDR